MSNVQIVTELENLKQLVLLMDDTLKHEVNTFWAVLGIGLALVLVLSVGWLNYFVTAQVDKKLKVEVEKALSEYSHIPEKFSATTINGWKRNDVNFWKDENGYVNLEGEAYGGVPGVKMLVFPKEYRPTQELKIPVLCSNGYGYCVIDIDGSATLHVPKDATVSLRSIKFKAGV